MYKNLIKCPAFMYGCSLGTRKKATKVLEKKSDSIVVGLYVRAGLGKLLKGESGYFMHLLFLVLCLSILVDMVAAQKKKGKRFFA